MTIGRKIITTSDDEPFTEIPPLFYSVVRPDICRGVWFAGVDMPRSLANRVDKTKPNLVAIGSPVLQEPGYAEIDSGTNYFDSGEAGAVEMAVMCVVRLHAKPTSSADIAYFFGDYGANHGSTLDCEVSDIVAKSYYSDADGATQLLTVGFTQAGFGVAPLPWRCLAAQYSDGGITIYDFTTGRSNTVAATAGWTRRVGSSLTMAMGAGAYGDFDTAANLRWDGSPTYDDLLAQYTSLKSLYADLGIAI